MFIQKSFYYDPQIKGYDTSFWATLNGSPSTSNGKIVLNSSEAIHLSQLVRGFCSMVMNIPSPSSGTDKKFGLLQPSKGVKALFVITDTTLTCEIVDDKGNSESQTVAWDSSWDGTDTTFAIKNSGSEIVFFINGAKVVSFEANIDSPMSFYGLNNNSNNMAITYVEAKDVESYVET